MLSSHVQSEEVEMVNTPSHDDHQTSSEPLLTPQSSKLQQTDGYNAFLILLTLSACIGGLLFGYDTGVISSTLVSIGTDLSKRPLTSLDKGLITASTSFFALLASPIAGYLADRIGRKQVILWSDILFVLGALVQAFSTEVWLMILGRSIVGLAIGAASLIVPLYISELAPGHLRGKLVIVQLLLITGGQAVAYLVGYGLSDADKGWRWMVGLGTVPAILQLSLITFMPETPRHLVKTGQIAAAEAILKKVFTNISTDVPTAVETTIQAIQAESKEEQSPIMLDSSKHITSSNQSSALHYLLTNPPSRRALTIACLLQFLQQACGFNSLMYFSASIFSSLGFTNPTLTSLTIALTNFGFTCLAFWTIDAVGRRRSLLSMIPAMTAALIICAISFHFVDLSTSGAVSTTATATNTNNPIGISSRSVVNDSNTATYAILASLILYVATYALSLGPLPWLQSELFPLPLRSLGSSISTATNWSLNTIVGLTFLPLMQAITPSGTFVVYAAVCVAGWVAVWWCYPELAGCEIEEVAGLLKHGWAVEASLRRWKERRALNGGGRRNSSLTDEDG